MVKKIVVATNNTGKLKEIKEILKDYYLLSLNDIDCNIDVSEDQETFEGNSKKKAKEISEFLNMPCIADDSGLCIEKYNGWPGVYTARFLGEKATNEEKNRYIIEKMKNLHGIERNATVKCCITYYEDGKYITGNGEIKGRIAEEIRGKNGFGFDGIFELHNGKTLAELTLEEKNTISARKLALQDLISKITVNNK